MASLASLSPDARVAAFDTEFDALEKVWPHPNLSRFVLSCHDSDIVQYKLERRGISEDIPGVNCKFALTTVHKVQGEGAKKMCLEV